MKRLFVRWILLAFSVFAASLLSQALNLGFTVHFWPFVELVKLFVGVAILSFLNATLGKLLKLITLPLSCITLGLFSLVVNAIVLWIAASLNLGFKIAEDSAFRAFVAAFVASIIISFINGVLGAFLPDEDD